MRTARMSGNCDSTLSRKADEYGLRDATGINREVKVGRNVKSPRSGWSLRISDNRARKWHCMHKVLG